MFLSNPYTIKILIASFKILFSTTFCKFTTNFNENRLILNKINASLYDLQAQYLNNVIFNIKQEPLT